jgi:hypothetical protein
VLLIVGVLVALRPPRRAVVPAQLQPNDRISGPEPVEAAQLR